MNNRMILELNKQHSDDVAFYKSCVSKMANGDEFDTKKLSEVSVRLNKSHLAFIADVDDEADRIQLAIKSKDLDSIKTALDDGYKTEQDLRNELEKFQQSMKPELDRLTTLIEKQHALNDHTWAQMQQLKLQILDIQSEVKEICF